MNTYARYPLTLERGKGARVWDILGNEFLDCVGGIACLPLGHGSQLVADALHEQALKLHQVSNLFSNEPQNRLSRWLTKNSVFDEAFFCNSGAEANEGAFKLSRKYGHTVLDAEIPIIISTHNSFHGRTLATITATGQPKYQKGFAPLMPGILHVDYNDFAALEKLFGEVNSSKQSKVAAVILEAIQAEGGVLPGDKEYFRKVRELCTRERALLIFDEVQTGVGRTGTFWAYERLEVEPDILTSAKGLGGGIPIGAMLAKKSCSIFEPGEHGSTFGGNPLVCSVALRVCETVSKKEFLENVLARGEELRAGLAELVSEFPSLATGVRGRGLLNGILLSPDWKFVANDVVLEGIKHGILTVPAGPQVLRLVPPLVITKQEISEAVEKLRVTFAALNR
jgi:acetylornithine/N-succinyldiaminopimelate aminotransferase